MQPWQGSVEGLRGLPVVHSCAETGKGGDLGGDVAPHREEEKEGLNLLSFPQVA